VPFFQSVHQPSPPPPPLPHLVLSSLFFFALMGGAPVTLRLLPPLSLAGPTLSRSEWHLSLEKNNFNLSFFPPPPPFPFPSCPLLGPGRKNFPPLDKGKRSCASSLPPYPSARLPLSHRKTFPSRIAANTRQTSRTRRWSLSSFFPRPGCNTAFFFPFPPFGRARHGPAPMNSGTFYPASLLAM